MSAAARDCYCHGDWLCHHHAPVETRIAVHIAVREAAARLAAAEKRAAEFEALYDNALRQSAMLVPRPLATNAQQEPGYPGEDTVCMSIRYPMLTAHKPTDRCAIQEPHQTAECGEFEAGETLREDAARFRELARTLRIYRGGSAPLHVEGWYGGVYGMTLAEIADASLAALRSAPTRTEP